VKLSTLPEFWRGITTRYAHVTTNRKSPLVSMATSTVELCLPKTRLVLQTLFLAKIKNAFEMNNMWRGL